MSHNFSPQLVDLYCDLAAHLMTLEFIQAKPPWVQWLAERALTGLPNRADYHAAAKMGLPGPNPGLEDDIAGTFSWADIDGQLPVHFAQSMRDVCRALHVYKLPPFPRESELSDL